MLTNIYYFVLIHHYYLICLSYSRQSMCYNLEDARFTVYEDEREGIITYVSTSGLQRQSNKGKLSSNEVVNSSRLCIEHKHSHHKTIQTGLSMTVLPTTALSIACCTKCSDSASKAEVASSRSRILQLVRRARAIATR